MDNNKKGRNGGDRATSNVIPDLHHTRPIVTGQCAEVLAVLQAEGSVISLHLTADLAIPEAAARIHNLRGMGFNIMTTILPEVIFRDRIRRNVARYDLGIPAWPAPGFLDGRGITGSLFDDLPAPDHDHKGARP